MKKGGLKQAAPIRQEVEWLTEGLPEELRVFAHLQHD